LENKKTWPEALILETSFKCCFNLSLKKWQRFNAHLNLTKTKKIAEGKNSGGFAGSGGTACHEWQHNFKENKQ